MTLASMRCGTTVALSMSMKFKNVLNGRYGGEARRSTDWVPTTASTEGVHNDSTQKGIGQQTRRALAQSGSGQRLRGRAGRNGRRRAWAPIYHFAATRRSRCHGAFLL